MATTQNQMDWLTIAGIIAQEGLAVAEAVYNKWASGQMPTAQDFADLRALGKKTPEGLLLQAATLAGIPADDARVTTLLALMSPTALTIPQALPKPVAPATPPAADPKFSPLPEPTPA